MAQIKPLPVELKEIAETELGEVAERIPNDLQALKTWIKQQPHLTARLDDQFLIQFLRGCKYNQKKAKEKLDRFFTIKSKIPDLFNVTDVNEARFRKISNFGLWLPLPRPLNDNGPRIFVLKDYGDVAKGLYEFVEVYRVLSTINEILMMDDPYVGINGIIYIWDLQHITMNFAAKYTPSLLKQMVKFYEQSLPFNIKGIHVINTPTFFQSILNILVSYFSEELKQKVTISGENLDNLQTIIPIKYLPTYLGGENGSMEEQRKEFEEKFLEYTDYLKENENYGTNEQLRSGKPIDFVSEYGLGGSLSELNVD